MSNEAQFKLEEGKFIRLSDGKVVGALVNGEIQGLHHTQEKFRDELLSLITSIPSNNEASEVSNESEPSAPEADQDEHTEAKAKEATAINEDTFEERFAEFAVEAAERGFVATLEPVEAIPADETPRELFHPVTGDLTEAVISWRRSNWPEDRFQQTYKGRI